MPRFGKTRTHGPSLTLLTGEPLDVTNVIQRYTDAVRSFELKASDPNYPIDHDRVEALTEGYTMGAMDLIESLCGEPGRETFQQFIDDSLRDRRR